MSMEQATAAFVQEAHEILAELEDLVLGLEDAAGPATIDAIFRSLHTLKGSGAMFGYSALARFTHHFETAYEQVRAGRLGVGRDLVNLSLEARDLLAEFLALEGEVTASEALLASDRTQELVARIRALTGEGCDAPSSLDGPTPADAPAPAGGMQSHAEGLRRYAIRFRPLPDALRNGMRPDLLMRELEELGTLELSIDAVDLPPLDVLDPTDAHLTWHAILETDAGCDAIEDVFIFADDAELDIAEAHPAPASDEMPADGQSPAARAPGQPPDDAPPPARPPDRSNAGSGPAPTASPTAPRTGRAGPGGQTGESLRIAASRLDEMMDSLGELVIAQARLGAVADRIADPTLEAVVEEIGALVLGLRDATLSIRMLPVETVFGKFRRVVRDLSAELGKEVRLVTEGGETEIDKNVIDRIGDPLVHMIRNSLDHGIEPSAERAGAGKPAAGTLRLAARQEGGEILVTIEDDGRGLDAAAIRAKAVERNLLAEDADPDERALHQLIFEPGFSTARELSSVSGRGVGMDAVRSAIDQLGGSVEIASRLGQGTCVTLRLPVTLAIVDGLRVRLGDQVYVIPLSAVEECVEMDRGETGRRSGRTVLRIRDDLVPYIELDRVLGLPASEEASRRVVIVRASGTRVGLVVDDILGQSQTVIKSLSPWHRAIPGLGGATILGDGRVALIVDVATLIRQADNVRALLEKDAA
jgi:two-component system chemotaxis sensor kinase CheA